MYKKRNNKGFTLIELLVVIAIIGTLASVVLASLNTARAKGRDAYRKASLSSIRVALELYYDDHGTYVVSGGGWNGGGLGWLVYESGSAYSTVVTRILYNKGF
ncbi:MAG: prepilin-type N-terminal cleavage/methylation domain-containing protein [Acidimicrobiales bacterium]|jgi:prepilin-type N-terminal cleavage/methylation domain-containing protein